MRIPPSNSDCIKDRTFSFLLNSDVSLSSLSRSISDFTAERLRPDRSLTGEEPPDDTKKSFIDFDFFPALDEDSKFTMQNINNVNYILKIQIHV